MAMHTGEASERDGDYYGRAVNRVARLRAIAEGGQILVSQSAAEILLDHLPSETGLVALGVQELRDFDRPETVYLLVDPTALTAPGRLGDGSHTAEIPVIVPGLKPASFKPAESLVRTPEESPPTGTMWEAVVDADREYHDRSGESDAAFPDDVRPRVILLTEPRVVIGRRSPSRGIELGIDLSEPPEDAAVSRVHAILERQPDGSYSLIDPGSTNGTFLNDFDKPIVQHVQMPLEPGDRIYLGAWTRIEIRSA